MHGHAVTVFEARPKSGGLNEYGIAAYKSTDDFAQKEVDFILGIGGIEVVHGKKLGDGLDLAQLQKDHDAVFLGLGLQGVNALGAAGDDAAGVEDAVDYIAVLRQASDLSSLPVGRRVVVIGGGMTAIDAAVQSRLLGAEDVHIVYRRGPEAMGASLAERDWAMTHGVTIHHWLAPEAIVGGDGPAAGHVVGVRFARQQLLDGRLAPTGQHETLAADTVFKAIGQKLDAGVLADIGLALQGGRIVADDDGRTGVAGLWAGGDCRAGGRDLTVEAVEDGKRAALSIHAALTNA
jgi:glutamate synthase (NADPH/NADH) small chain